MSEGGQGLLGHGNHLLALRHELPSSAQECLKPLVRQDWLLFLLNRKGDGHSLM